MKNEQTDHEAACLAMEDQIDAFEQTIQTVQHDLHSTRKMAREMELSITRGLQIVQTKRKVLTDLRQRYGLSA